MLESSGWSESGPVRPNNEDAFVADPSLSLFAVADGMGGHAAGEVAAQVAIETLEGAIRQTPTRATAGDGCRPDARLSPLANRLRTAICLANERILMEAAAHRECTGMGTTIVSALVAGNRVAIGHVGDSRLYLLSRGRLDPLTRDDTWVAAMLAGGDPDPRRAALHPLRNVLTNVLGARHHLEIHIAERTLEPGDTLLLCSDGVHGVLDDEALQGLLTSPGGLEGVARAIVSTAISIGSRDNATAVVVRYAGE